MLIQSNSPLYLLLFFFRLKGEYFSIFIVSCSAGWIDGMDWPLKKLGPLKKRPNKSSMMWVSDLRVLWSLYHSYQRCCQHIFSFILFLTWIINWIALSFLVYSLGKWMKYVVEVAMNRLYEFWYNPDCNWFGMEKVLSIVKHAYWAMWLCEEMKRMIMI